MGAMSCAIDVCEEEGRGVFHPDDYGPPTPNGFEFSNSRSRLSLLVKLGSVFREVPAHQCDLLLRSTEETRKSD